MTWFQTDRIHVANGTLFLDGTFSEVKEYCRNRLPVAYDPDASIASDDFVLAQFEAPADQTIGQILLTNRKGYYVTDTAIWTLDLYWQT